MWAHTSAAGRMPPSGQVETGLHRPAKEPRGWQKLGEVWHGVPTASNKPTKKKNTLRMRTLGLHTGMDVQKLRSGDVRRGTGV